MLGYNHLRSTAGCMMPCDTDTTKNHLSHLCGFPSTLTYIFTWDHFNKPILSIVPTTQDQEMKGLAQGAQTAKFTCVRTQLESVAELRLQFGFSWASLEQGREDSSLGSRPFFHRSQVSTDGCVNLHLAKQALLHQIPWPAPCLLEIEQPVKHETRIWGKQTLLERDWDVSQESVSLVMSLPSPRCCCNDWGP